jgi:large subunit ribosomal protein L25
VRKDINVAAEVRTSRGKNEARRTRRAGQIPAVLYGAYQDPVSIAVNPREIVTITHSSTGYNTIFNLAIQGGETTPVMVVDQQVDPLKGNLLHADFKRIDLTKRIRVTVSGGFHRRRDGVDDRPEQARERRGPFRLHETD